MGRTERRVKGQKEEEKLLRRKSYRKGEQDRQDSREKHGKRRGHVFSHLDNKTTWNVKQSGALQEIWKVLCGRRSSHQ